MNSVRYRFWLIVVTLDKLANDAKRRAGCGPSASEKRFEPDVIAQLLAKNAGIRRGWIPVADLLRKGCYII